ncbi:MAG: antibiotic biosynthesis monooxygenase [Pantoea sp. Brub]|nr:antibiotic biosynthesis monooxygenase [Pantoea sp. Brub]
MLTVVSEICVKPGCRQIVLQAIKKIVPIVLDEEGCCQYDILLDYQAQIPWKYNLPNSVFILEKWKSLRYLEYHQQMRHMEKHRIDIKDDIIDLKILILELSI